MPLPAFYEQHLMESDEFKKLQATQQSERTRRRQSLLKEFAAATERNEREIAELNDQRSAAADALAEAKAVASDCQQRLLGLEQRFSKLTADWDGQRRRQFLAMSECVDESLERLLTEIDQANQQANREFSANLRGNQAAGALSHIRSKAEELARTKGSASSADATWFRDAIRRALALP